MYADGDPIGELPVRARALKEAVMVRVPSGGAVTRAFGELSTPLPHLGPEGD